MKKRVKLLGIVAVLATMGFFMGCDNPANNGTGTTPGTATYFTYGGMAVREYNGQATIREGEATGDVVIPAVVNGFPVSTIGAGAFADNEITSVVIPASVRVIGEGAFRDNSLTTLTIPSGVQTIGRYAFRGNSLTEITLPASVETLSDYAFTAIPAGFCFGG